MSGPTKAVDVPLLGTPAVDLRTLPWDNLRQLEHDLGNYHQARLSTLVAAMNLVGLDVNYFDSQPPRDVVDDVIRAARSAGWHLLTREERHACGVYTEAAEEQEEVVAQPAEPEASDEGESETSTTGKRTKRSQLNRRHAVAAGADMSAEFERRLAGQPDAATAFASWVSSLNVTAEEKSAMVSQFNLGGTQRQAAVRKYAAAMLRAPMTKVPNTPYLK